MELSEESPGASNTTSSTNSSEITPDNYITELTDLMVTDGFQDRVQKQFVGTNLPPSVKDLNIRAASVSSLEIELKGSDPSSPDKLDYSVIDPPTHGVLKTRRQSKIVFCTIQILAMWAQIVSHIERLTIRA